MTRLVPAKPGTTMLPPVLTTHAEKMQFLMNYLEDKIPECPRSRPLILRDGGGTGKTTVLNAFAKVTPFSFVHLNIEQRAMVHKGHLEEEVPQGYALPLIVEMIAGVDGEEGVLRYLDGYCVTFVADPAFRRVN